MFEPYLPDEVPPLITYVADQTAEITEDGKLKVVWDNQIIVAAFDPQAPYNSLRFLVDLQPHVVEAVTHWWQQGFDTEEWPLGTTGLEDG